MPLACFAHHLAADSPMCRRCELTPNRWISCTTNSSEWHRNHSIPVLSYAENVGLYKARWYWRPLPLGLVVPRASANPVLPATPSATWTMTI